MADVASRIMAAGYLFATIVPMLRKRLGGRRIEPNKNENLKKVVIPYYHSVSNNIKAISRRHGEQLI